ncbi:hypothetical protein JZ751_015084 [Albula glossodonta]|uniref:Uncharacterized protein n=1 Tax=Albula glossodonta TaxID=121402 RepID=A0A8T2NZN5_9TELE|nr:hypothetical protein JZ751_015084 [Albula glossodonta]
MTVKMPSSTGACLPLYDPVPVPAAISQVLLRVTATAANKNLRALFWTVYGMCLPIDFVFPTRTVCCLLCHCLKSLVAVFTGAQDACWVTSLFPSGGVAVALAFVRAGDSNASRTSTFNEVERPASSAGGVLATTVLHA